MKHLGLVLSLFSAAVAQEPGIRLAEPWRQPYLGQDATGPQVIGLWSFDAGAETRDSSGHGLELKLLGGTIRADGRFGGALGSARGWPEVDQPHGASAGRERVLSPPGAFTIELWLRADETLKGYGQAFLIDKRWSDPTDYQLVLSAADPQDRRVVQAVLGFGTRTATFASTAAVYEPGVWHHLAMTYDGVGTVRFFRDGSAFGSRTEPGLGPIMPGRQPLILGDRVGSRYFGFPGSLDQVRLCHGALEFRPAAVAWLSRRTVFRRLEEVDTPLELRNLTREPLRRARVALSLDGRPTTVEAPELPAGGRLAIPYRVDTRLRPDRYRLVAELELPGEPAYHSEDAFEVTVVARPVPGTMPVILWGGTTIRDARQMRELGFTHFLGLPVNYTAIWQAGEPTAAAEPESVARACRDLDTALAEGLSISHYLYPGRWARDKPELRRVRRDGQPYPTAKPDICPRHPELKRFCENVGASVARTFGEFPAFVGVDIQSEVRDASQPCFHEADRAAFKAATGLDIPAEAQEIHGVAYQRLPGFPADRVIPDDFPLYRYYRWLWKDGDGWNALHDDVLRGLRSTGRNDLLTRFAPAVRAASVWGSGGDVDVLSQWTYSYPDPIRIGLATDELFAMASGSPRHPAIIKATQLIWYRSQTAPETGEAVGAQSARFEDQDVKQEGAGAAKTPPRAEWERREPDARFITIAPVHLRECVWTSLARPIQGLMHHGWQSLVEGQPYAYRYTHPDTQEELRRLTSEVVQPLGPMLRRVPDRPADVAFLESFAAQMLAGRGNYGWCTGWAGDVYEALAYAQLQPEVVYDETVVERGLDQYKVLVMVHCDVLTAGVARAVQDFQKRGGLVIGDELLAPAIRPDLALVSFERPKRADEAKTKVLELAAQLRHGLDGRYRRYAESSDPEVVTRVRQAGGDYLFAVNDHREFGDYVGHHGLVMENGVPARATLTVRRADGHVYDLVAHRPIQAARAGGKLTFEAGFGPGQGRLFLITSRPPAAVRVAMPDTARLGESVAGAVSVVDAEGKPVVAVLPVQLAITDPAGRPAEGSGCYAARDGRLTVKLDLAPNDRPGVWSIRVDDLAAGLVGEAWLRVTR